MDKTVQLYFVCPNCDNEMNILQIPFICTGCNLPWKECVCNDEF